MTNYKFSKPSETVESHRSKKREARKQELQRVDQQRKQSFLRRIRALVKKP